MDRVVVGENAVVPDLMDIVQFTLDVDEAIGKRVGRRVEIAVGLNESTFSEDFS